MATSAHISSASATPRSPVAALAQPLLSTTAAARPPVAVRCACVVTTGAAVILFCVNTPAAATGGAVDGGHEAQVRVARRLDPAGHAVGRRTPARP